MLSVLRFVIAVQFFVWVLPVAASVGDRLAIVVNSADPQSQQIADYYQTKRGIPDENIIVVTFSAKENSLSKNKFQQIYQQVLKQTPAHVQFYALAWSKPYKVTCMSITSAFAFGFDEKYCAKGCKATAASAYFNSDSRAPFDDLNIRPTMLLAGSTKEQVRAMIDRGVRSDNTQPDAVAYLMNTTDKARNTRAGFYPSIITGLGERLILQQVNGDVLKNKNDVLFYFTGLKMVEKITSNTFVDGAIADHLTSAGGVLFDGKQMSVLRWLDAGATASYGAVVEPCSFHQKFPHPGVVIDRYTRGETLIEAYWKSVQWPGQGLFVGEPLAEPFSRPSVNGVEL